MNPLLLWRQVMDLEAKLAAKGGDYSADSSSNSALRSGAGLGQDPSRRLPKGPARAVLAGHRGPVSSVAVHPVYR